MQDKHYTGVALMSRSDHSLVVPLPSESNRLPSGFLYMTWMGCPSAHVTRDQTTALCGSRIPAQLSSLVTADPFGKPRCLSCLKLLAGPHSVKTEEEEATNADYAIAELEMPPPEFFIRKGR